MAFRPNYRQQRAERDRQARARQAEKLKKLHEKSEQRKPSGIARRLLRKGSRSHSDSSARAVKRVDGCLPDPPGSRARHAAWLACSNEQTESL